MKSKALIVILYTVLGSFLSACSNSGDGISEYLVPGKESLKKTLEVLQVELDCGKDCNPSIGQLLLDINKVDIFGRKNYYSCTSFLAGEYKGKSVIGTNLHCLTGGNMRVQTPDCTTTLPVGVTFPALGKYKKDWAVCTKILARSNDPGKDARSLRDYAFLLLNKKIERPHLKISQEGIPDNSTLIYPHIDPNPRTGGGTLKVSVCHSRMSMAVQYDYFHKISKVFAASGCQIEKGNSGSPVLNESDSVVGIANAELLTFEELEGLKKPMKEPKKSRYIRNMSGFENIDEILFGTNFACIDVPALNLTSSNKPMCNIPFSSIEGKKAMLDKQVGAGVFELHSELQNWMDEYGTDFDLLARHTTQNPKDYIKNFDNIVIVLPKCILKERAASMNELSVEFPVIQLKNSTDKKGYLKVSPGIKWNQYKMSRIANDETQVNVRMIGGEGKDFKLAVCSNNNISLENAEQLLNKVEEEAYIK